MTFALPMKTDEEINREWAEIKAAKRDPGKFRPLYNRYHKRIFLFIFKRTANEALTADLTSQTFLKVLEQLPKYEFRGIPFSAWLYRIAANMLNQHFRHNKAERVISLQESELQLVAQEVEENNFEARQEAVANAMQDLEHEEVMLLEMRYFERKPFSEVAEILEITENNAKVKMHRVLKKIRQLITEKGNYNG